MTELEDEVCDSEERVREREEDEEDASALEEAAEALLLLLLPQDVSRSMEAAKANKLMCFIKPPMNFSKKAAGLIAVVLVLRRYFTLFLIWLQMSQGL